LRTGNGKSNGKNNGRSFNAKGAKEKREVSRRKTRVGFCGGKQRRYASAR
jgi:hypothetical protein